VKYDEALAEIMARVRDAAGKLGDGPDTVSETPAAYEIVLKSGLSFYSKLRPRRRTQTVACGADGRIACSGIVDFDEGFVNLLAFEYPISFGEPAWLDDDAWILDQDVDGVNVIRFTSTVPATGQPVRVAHFCEHKVPTDPAIAFTVRDSDMGAVVGFAAAEAMFILSAEYAQSSEHTILNAQISISINKSDTYRSRGNELRKRIFEQLRAGRLNNTVHAVRG
jgi:hypothetical protein